MYSFSQKRKKSVFCRQTHSLIIFFLILFYGNQATSSMYWVSWSCQLNSLGSEESGRNHRSGPTRASFNSCHVTIIFVKSFFHKEILKWFFFCNTHSTNFLKKIVHSMNIWYYEIAIKYVKISHTLLCYPFILC